MDENSFSGRTTDELYIKLLELEQEHSNKRWTITTFFLGISFAILGFSFTSEKAQIPIIVPYAAAIISYWFAYLLFVRLNDYTKFLRNYLGDLEDTGQVPFKLQTETQAFMQTKHRFSTTQLLLYFGLFYTGAIIALSLWLTA